MGDWLKPAKKKRPSGLSNIPENARVEARLFFTLIGHGAWQLAEALWSKSNEMYPTLQEEKGRFSFFGKSGNTLSLPRSGKRKTPTPSFLRSGQDAPFVAKVLLDETSEVGVGEISEHLEAKPKKDRRSWASRRTMSSLGGISLGGQSSFSAKTRKSAMSSASSGSCGSRRRMAAISYYPVEKFIDEVPITQSTERWRYSCLLFLLDPRREAMGESIMAELQRRQQEIKMWLKLNESNMQGDAFESGEGLGVVPEESRRPRLNAVVIFHRPPKAWLACARSMDSISLEAVDESAVEIMGRDQRYQPFLDSVRELVCAPTETLWHYCNFDDTEEVLKCHVKIAQSLVDGKAFERNCYEAGQSTVSPGFGIMSSLGTTESDAESGRRRCVVM